MKVIACILAFCLALVTAGSYKAYDYADYYNRPGYYRGYGYGLGGYGGYQNGLLYRGRFGVYKPGYGYSQY